MPTAKDCHALTSYYLAGYREKIGTPPIVNRNKARWGFEAILYDLTVREAKDLIDYYLEANSSRGHSIEWFFNNYEKLVQIKADAEEDERERKRLRAESKKRVEEWKAKHANS